MADEIVVRGTTVKLRHPWGTWALTLLTLGIYGLVYWYKINREMRDYSAAAGQPFDNDPALAVLALFPGGILIVPAIMTYIYTARRVRQTQEMTAQGAVVEGVSSPLTVLLALLGSFHMIYLQYALNGCWNRARAEAPAEPLPPPPPPAPAT